MPQPILENISIRLSRKSGDEVTTATASGKIYSANQRITAINEARSNLYLEMFNLIGIEAFKNIYHEFIKETGEIDLTVANEFTSQNPDYTRQILLIKLRKDNSSTFDDEAKPLPVDAYYEAEINPYSPFKPDADNLKFKVVNTTFTVLGITSTYKAKVIYLQDIVPLNLGAAFPDIADPVIWETKTIEMAYQQLLIDLQRRAS